MVQNAQKTKEVNRKYLDKGMRKAKPKRRVLLPDPKFNDTFVTRFVNNMMLDGKKSILHTIFFTKRWTRIEKRAEGIRQTPLEIWKASAG
jgi:small subunit ribosomal protein S7